ncbi:MAG: dihydropteroate synthase [Bacteroidales bacterium]|jgi:dihydropteroate synthase
MSCLHTKQEAAEDKAKSFESPLILGIVNITEDSFSDGGRYLAADAAIAHADLLAEGGADIIDLGAAASNVASKEVAPQTEIERLAPVVEALHAGGKKVSVDTFSTKVQSWALSQNVAYLNDIQGFPDAKIYPELAESNAKLIVMHSVQGRGRATEIDVPPQDILDRILRFFERRIHALTAAGIARERIILDPGMGFFLGSNPETSLTVLRNLPKIKETFGMKILVGVSRKSFLRKITKKQFPTASLAATLAAELFAAENKADYIRTHNTDALFDALTVLRAATGQA